MLHIVDFTSTATTNSLEWLMRSRLIELFPVPGYSRPTMTKPGEGAGPLFAYRQKLIAGSLATDPAQAVAAERLQGLWTKLRDYDPPPQPEKTRFIGRLLRKRAVEEAPSGPNGLYLVGEVGRGKSMLMDLFFAEAKVARKQRIHFHAFMQDMHARVFSWKQSNPGGSDPVPPLADDIAKRAALLCFDEFQINDIADAMILGRLFAALFERAVVVVATSNVAPDDLFRGRPGRDAFLPFIELIKRHLDVLVLDGERDFRRARLRGLPTWHVPPNGRADAALDRAFVELSGGAQPRAERLTVSGRTLRIPLAADRVARFDFTALCGQPLGPGDYIAVATQYDALILDGIPRLGPENYDQARRFITLVDALYEHRVKLVASAEATPDQLYQRGEGAKAFERTASRLEEMQGQEWLEMQHLT
jgi:cell division protein ZapE